MFVRTEQSSRTKYLNRAMVMVEELAHAFLLRAKVVEVEYHNGIANVNGEYKKPRVTYQILLITRN